MISPVELSIWLRDVITGATVEPRLVVRTQSSSRAEPVLEELRSYYLFRIHTGEAPPIQIGVTLRALEQCTRLTLEAGLRRAIESATQVGAAEGHRFILTSVHLIVREPPDPECL